MVGCGWTVAGAGRALTGCVCSLGADGFFGDSKLPFTVLLSVDAIAGSKKYLKH